MTKAIGYTRISDKDQSNFSISGQADIITTYCQKNNISLVTLFTDEGESAKNFDRVDWKQLELFVKKNHNGVDMLLVAKFDRFSRNVSEALAMIEMLEKRYHIKVISAMEPIHLHPDSPFYFQFRSQILLGADVELRIIRDRTKFGMHQAAKSGRHIGKAPVGYKNVRDENNKPTIVVDPPKAALIVAAFESFLRGDTIISIRKRVGVTGNSAMQQMLQHPVYMGFVRVPAYYDDAEKIIKGIHEPIISEDTWWKVQAIFNAKKKVQRTTINSDFPLRGVLKCFCDRPFTAAFSKGRKEYIGYYKCNTHTMYNHNSVRLHNQLDEVLKHMSLSGIHLQYLTDKVLEKITTGISTREKQVQEKKQQVISQQKKIDNLEEKYLDNDIDKDTYVKWKMRYHTELSILRQALSDLGRPAGEAETSYRQSLAHLADLQWIFSKGSVENKQAIVRTVFNNQLYYQDKVYRTTFLMDLFKPKAALLAEKRLLIYEEPSEDLGDFAESAPSRSIIEPLFSLLDIISNIKTA